MNRCLPRFFIVIALLLLAEMLTIFYWIIPENPKHMGLGVIRVLDGALKAGIFYSIVFYIYGVFLHPKMHFLIIIAISVLFFIAPIVMMIFAANFNGLNGLLSEAVWW